MPEAHPARTYPAHDEHPMEKVTVAVDPYDVEYKANIFSVNYRNYAFMPVFFVITNDSDQPIALAGMKAQLNTVNRNKLLSSRHRRYRAPHVAPLAQRCADTADSAAHKKGERRREPEDDGRDRSRPVQRESR